MIRVENLQFAYAGASKDTLKGLDFNIDKGEILGFLGPSGSGKSTTQKIMIGLLKNYRGSIKVMDKEVHDWDNTLYEHIGVSFELPNHYLKLTARENLEHFAGFYKHIKFDPDTVLNWVDLHNDADKLASDFSKGMKIRLNVARALMHNPKILFLDEPTSGLDPVNAKRIKDLVLSLREKGTTIFVTTHNMSLADELCDRVAFITNGKISTIDAPEKLKAKYGKRSVRVDYVDNDNLINKEFELDGLGHNQDFLKLIQSDRHIERIHTQETTLDNIFIEVTGKELVQ
ncbi:fluoroquinolone transport system ATP-binding protein [Maritalea mobilis]|uniref:Fluoroquinolone transport system ATP-binding protein n=1 Tax=Maritalea mobilis TaxID=483324 RepID=A0A4R6VXX8_9HYPH|nr:ABC transporter ATP-binding protein [Maritalea mobilis]TDQ67440.1 fluoroquinolone transport system ATP-binding protein [Maritalea mobilis]